MTSIINKIVNLNSKNHNDVLQRFIQSKSIADVIQKVKPTYRKILDLPLTATMEEAFDLLLAEDILSVPIYHTEGNDKKYVAIVSALDLLKLLSTKVRCLCNDREKNNTICLRSPLTHYKATVMLY